MRWPLIHALFCTLSLCCWPPFSRKRTASNSWYRLAPGPSKRIRFSEVIEEEFGYHEVLPFELWQEIIARADGYGIHAISAVSKRLRSEILGKEKTRSIFFHSSESILAGYINSPSLISKISTNRMISALSAARNLEIDERDIIYAKLLMRAASIESSRALQQHMNYGGTTGVAAAVLQENIASGVVDSSLNTIEAFEEALEQADVDPLRLPFVSLLLPCLMMTKSPVISQMIVTKSLPQLWLDYGCHNVLWVKGIMETIFNSVYSFMTTGIFKEKIEKLQALGMYMDFEVLNWFYQIMNFLASVQAPDATDLRAVFNDFHRKVYDRRMPTTESGSFAVSDLLMTALRWQIPLVGLRNILIHESYFLRSLKINRGTRAALSRYFFADISSFDEDERDFVLQIRENCSRLQ